jgi:hypothetical protein
MCGVAQSAFRVARYAHGSKRGSRMKTTQIIGMLLIVAGVLGLVFGGFSYTKDTTALKVGPIELKVQEKESVSIPMVASGAAIAIGAFLMFAGRIK